MALLKRDGVNLRTFLIFISMIVRGLAVMSSVRKNSEWPLNGQPAACHSCILMGPSGQQHSCCVPLLAFSPCLTWCPGDNGTCFLPTPAKICFNTISSAYQLWVIRGSGGNLWICHFLVRLPLWLNSTPDLLSEVLWKSILAEEN